MKRILCCFLAILFAATAFSSCAAPSRSSAPVTPPSGGETPASESDGAAESSSEEESASETPDDLEPQEISFGVYYLISAEGKALCMNQNYRLLVDSEDELSRRFTVHPKRSPDGTTYLAVYRGDDEDMTLSYALTQGKMRLFGDGNRYTPKDSGLWLPVFDEETGCYRLLSKVNENACITVRDKVGVEEVIPGDKAQLFRFEKAAPSTRFREYVSTKGNVVIRIPDTFVTKKAIGATDELMQNYADWMQESYEAEIDLTGYIPYDVIVFDLWQKQNIVAGVVNDYNYVKADKDFMENEIKKMVQRARNLKIKDLCFTLLHEMGHMFDSNRAWCFESEAWTDLKLCYVIKKVTDDHAGTDKLLFGCSSSDYDGRVCHTYETIADGLDIHAKKGAMTTVYGFFGAARLFLLMAYDFGWEPFKKTFHYYQDAGMTQSAFDENGKFNNWKSFLSFVEKLSEYSGKEIRTEYLTDENWEVFRKYYTHEDTRAV